MGLKSVLFGSPSRSSSESTTSQFGLDTSSSFGRTGSSQRVAFEELFASLYGGAAGAAAGIDTGAISGAAEQLFSGGLSFLEQLGGGAGADALAGRLTDTSARDENLRVLKTSLGELFSESLLPAITGRGVSTGTLGGARDAVEIGSASKAIGEQFSKGAAGIISADQAQRDSIAAQLAQLTQTGAGQGISALSSLYGLKQQAAGGAGLAPYEMLAAILGGPTVLGESFGEEGSSSYGFQSGTSKSTSTGTGGTQGLAQSFLSGATSLIR